METTAALRILSASLWFVTLTAVLAACDLAPDRQPNIRDTSWRIVQLEDRVIPDDITLVTFAAGSEAMVSLGCEAYAAIYSYDADGGGFTLSLHVPPDRHCEASGYEDVLSEVRDALEAAEEYEVADGGELILHGTSELTLVPVVPWP